MAIVWPCPLPVDAYVAAGRKVEVPRPVCPSCAGPLVFWSGYWRHVRAAGRCRKIFVPRGALRPVPGEPCAAAGVHAGLAAGCGRDGRRGDRAGGRRRVRGPPGGGAAGGSVYDRARLGAAVPGARLRSWGWCSRRWRWSWAGRRSARPLRRAGSRWPRSARRSTRPRACRDGWRLGAWRFAASVSGGRLIAANTGSPFLVGRQTAFHASCPIGTAMKEETVDHKGQEEIALHRWAVIAEAAGPQLTAGASGGRWSARSPRAYTHPDGSSRTYSRGRSTAGCGRGAGAGWRR